MTTTLEELVAVAQRIDPSAEVKEESYESDGVLIWSVRSIAPTIPLFEARASDAERARRLLLTSLVELLFERGEIDAFEWAFAPAHLQGYAAYRRRAEKNVRILEALESVLAADVSEEAIQRQVERSPEVWGFVTNIQPRVVSKFKLGESFVTDFLVFGEALYSQIQLPTATFVELERPSHRLFTRRGEESAELRHGLRQLRDWKYWISDNKQYVRDRLVERIGLDWRRWSGEGQVAGSPAYGFAQQFLLVIGRRRDMTPDERLRLQRLNDDQGDFKIVTYDMLLDPLLPEMPWPDFPWDDS